MPSRGTYQIANREEGKQAQRDQSYRSCILALLIFFFLCIVLILATVPWKRSYGSSRVDEDEDFETARHHGVVHHEHTTVSTSRTTDTTKSVIESTTSSATKSQSKGTADPVEYVTDPYVKKKTGYHRFEQYTNNATTTEGTEEPETILDQDLHSTKYTTPSYEATNYTKQSTTVRFGQIETDTSSTTEEAPTTLLDETTLSSITVPSTTNSSPVLKNVVTDQSSTENPTTEGTNNTYHDALSSTTEEYTADTGYTSSTSEVQNNTTINTTSATEDATTYSFKNATETTETTTYQTTEQSTIPNTTITQSEAPTTFGHDKTTVHSTTEDLLSTTEISVEKLSSAMLTTTEKLSFNKEVCMSGECKQLASKMLFYMNHTTDPCEDFYEYACGGFEESRETVDRDLESLARERIARQILKERSENKTSLFMEYYDSCVEYENVNMSERIRLAREELNKVGRFYTTSDWTKSHPSFTELIAKLLLHHSALLFDISPDLDEYHSNQFTFKIGPSLYKDPFETDEMHDSCYADEFKRETEKVDLEELYKQYKTCKTDTKEFIRSISEALTALGVFDELSMPYNISQNIHMTVINIDFELVQKYFANYPSKSQIREAYLMKNYTHMSVKELEQKYKLVNWTQLIFLLTNRTIAPEVKLQIYFRNELQKGLDSLEMFNRNNPMILHNALLGLYARNLYHEFVLSKHRDVKEHCLRVAMNLLIPEASSMYIGSFSEDELAHMTKMVRGTFSELIETLGIKLRNVTWAAEEARQALLHKVSDLKVVVPDISYLSNSNSTYQKCNAHKINMTANYFENSMTLMRRYRMLMYYEESFKDPSDPEQIWTHYATPFQSKGLAVYGLNLVVIPFGVFGWPVRYNQTMFDYLSLATLGTTIAHQIAHHFDANGIYYSNGTRDTEDTILFENDSATSNFEEYITCQKESLYADHMNMSLPFTGQTVSYRIPQLTLNERLSEGMGLRLARDTLDRLRLRSTEIQLPWLDMGPNQLFYLAYAQMHCTKSPLTSSYISLYENEQLPSRIRIFVSASNDGLLGKAWDCREGSGMSPSYTCNVFPDILGKDTTVDSA